MAFFEAAGKRLVLSPQEPLVAGGPAEEYERRVQELLASGHHHLIIDLGGVADMDTVGMRALVRGHTSAQRLGGTFRLAGPSPKVRNLLQESRLDSVFEIYDSLDQAQVRQWPWKTIATVAGGVILFTVLMVTSIHFAEMLATPEVSATLGVGEKAPKYGATTLHPFLELLKLVFAAFVGIMVTAVHKRTRGDKPISRSLEQAQILLCVAGALMMILIGNSIARAFGIAGAASIIRFRTPVEDPRDTTILFLAVGLGMSCGVGAFAVAGLGALFLCIFLLVLDHIGREKQRSMMVQLQAETRDFPVAHVQSVFARYRITFEPREISQGDKAGINYFVKLDPHASLEELSSQLMSGSHGGIKSVMWRTPKKDEG
jgi:anti-anti-sigma factor